MALTPEQQVLEDAAEQKIVDAEAAFEQAKVERDQAWDKWNDAHSAIFQAQKELRELHRSFRN